MSWAQNNSAFLQRKDAQTGLLVISPDTSGKMMIILKDRGAQPSLTSPSVCVPLCNRLDSQNLVGSALRAFERYTGLAASRIVLLRDFYLDNKNNNSRTFIATILPPKSDDLDYDRNHWSMHSLDRSGKTVKAAAGRYSLDCLDGIHNLPRWAIEQFKSRFAEGNSGGSPQFVQTPVFPYLPGIIRTAQVPDHPKRANRTLARGHRASKK